MVAEYKNGKIVAVFVGIDSFNRPVFKSSNGEFYCLTDKLYSHGEIPKLEEIEHEEVVWKGRRFEGEPMSPVFFITLTLK